MKKGRSKFLVLETGALRSLLPSAKAPTARIGNRTARKTPPPPTDDEDEGILPPPSFLQGTDAHALFNPAKASTHTAGRPYPP